MKAQMESGTDKEKLVAKDFIEQVRLGKSFARGVDKEGRPICYVRVRKHRKGVHCEESLERYTIYTIETARMMIKAPIDTAVSLYTRFGIVLMRTDIGV
jgi:hypothetical protein